MRKGRISPKKSTLKDLERFIDPTDASLNTPVISNYNTLPVSETPYIDQSEFTNTNPSFGVYANGPQQGRNRHPFGPTYRTQNPEYQNGGLPKYQNAGLEKKIEVKPFVTSDLKEATKRTRLYNDSLYNYDLSQQHKEAAINKGLTPSPNKGTASTRSRSYENRHTRLGLGISDHFDKYKSFEGSTDLTGNKEYKGISTRENKRDSIPNRMDALDYELYRYAPTVGRTFGEIADVTSDTWALFANVLSGNNLELEGTNTTEHRYEAVPQYKKPTQPVIYKPETDIQESDFVTPGQLKSMFNSKKEEPEQKATTKEPSVIRPTITKVVKDAEGNIISTEEGISQKEAGRRFNNKTKSWERMRYGGYLPKYQNGIPEEVYYGGLLPEVAASPTENYPFFGSLSKEQKDYMLNSSDTSSIMRGIQAQAKSGYGKYGQPTFSQSVENTVAGIPGAVGNQLLEAAGIPQAALVEGIKEIVPGGQRGNIRNISPGLTSAFTGDATARQELPSEYVGFKNPGGFFDSPAAFGKNIANMAIDAVTDPVDLIGAGIVLDGIKGAKKVATSLPKLSNINLKPDWAKWNKSIPNNKPLMKEYDAIEASTKADGTWMRNSDGSEFAGTPEQFIQQQSENFKAAFGESKLLNPDGSPTIQYHGTAKEFDTFDPDKFQLGDSGYSGLGIYTSPSKVGAESYSLSSAKFHTGEIKPTVMELYGLGKNPIRTHELPEGFDLFNFHRKRNFAGDVPIEQQLLDHDVAIRTQRGGTRIAPDHGSYENVFPTNTQLKSAVGNDGMFDMTNPNIYKSLLPIGGAAGIMGATVNDGVNKKQKGGNIYNVKSGDTFLGIGNRHNITPKALTTANPGIDINKLSIGQNINIPNNAGYGMPQGIFNNYSKIPSNAPKINQTIKAAPVQTSLSSTVTPEFLEHLRLREGKKVNAQDQHYSYYDSEDRLTGGIGHLMTAKERAAYPKGTTIPKKLVSSWLLKDSKKAYNAAIKQAKELGIDNQDFVNSLASVNYQLGTGWRDKFTKTWGYLKDKNYEKAIPEAADSKWYRQTPVRVKDFQKAIGNLYKYGGSTKNYANVYDKGGKMGNSPMVARLDKYMAQYGITNPYLKSAMMGVILAEGSMTGKAENMNYSVSRLPEVWSTFSTTGKRVAKGTGAKYANALAKKYARNPQALANFIYGNRLGNSGRDTNDGYTYRGRGLNQLTGKGSYKKMGEKLGVDLVNNPELLNTDPDIQAHAAVRFLYDRIAKELPKLVNKNSKYKKRFGEYVDFNNIDNLKDASFLMTSANAGLGNIPKQEAFNKRLKGSEKYVDLFIEGYTPPENMENFETTQSTQPVQSTETFAPLQATEIINKQKDNALEFKRKANVDMLENFNVNNIINQNAIDINIPNDVALDQKNAYIDKLNTSMPGPKNIPRFGQAQLFK